MKKLTLALSLIYSQAFSQTADTSKQAYHLFNPTPKSLMRGMETDRPDITESAYSVDAGHFQVETDVFKSVKNKTDGVNTTQYFYNLANLKIGLSNSSDLQLVVENYVTEKNVDLNNTISRKAGFGQLTLRFKQNIWGNDAGKTALAVMPYITFPNGKFAEHNSIEGGIIIPFALELNEVWGMGAQAQLDFLKTESGYEPQILNSITFARDFGQRWNAFIESYYTYQTQVKLFNFSVNGGVSYSISPNLKLDAGFNYGISKNTDKVYFTGFSFRY
jgi:hypothetical protein